MLPDGAGVATETKGLTPERKAAVGAGEAGEMGEDDPLAAELAVIDAVLARSEAVITDARSARRRGESERDPLVYDLDWHEDERLNEWRMVLAETEDLPPVMRVIVLLDAWNTLHVLQHAPWLGRLLAGSVLRQAGVTTAAHLAAINLGLRSIPVDQRRHPRRETRLLATARGLIAAAETGLTEHDRLVLARQVMERKLIGRRTSSKLPDLIEMVLARPLVHSGTVSKVLGVTPQAALKIIGELGLREMTGRGRFRAWGAI